jgi:hypothetical protein
VKSQRPKVGQIRNPTLFEIKKPEEAVKVANAPTAERPYSLPGILVGTSAFTAAGWEGSFYPRGMQSRDFLSYYATQFATVEVDSTFYGCPSARTVNNWADRIRCRSYAKPVGQERQADFKKPYRASGFSTRMRWRVASLGAH